MVVITFRFVKVHIQYTSLAKKHNHIEVEQACQASLEVRALSYKAVKEELEWIKKQTEPSVPETLPAHENVRGKDYYQ